MKYLSVLVFGIIFLNACTKSNKVIEETWANGSPKIERLYKGEGSAKEMIKETKYYENKQKEMVGEYKDAKRDGYWVYYYENGNKWSEGYFKDDLDDGKRTVYFENGNKRYEGTYTKGVQTGIWKFYKETGELDKEVDYDKK